MRHRRTLYPPVHLLITAPSLFLLLVPLSLCQSTSSPGLLPLSLSLSFGVSILLSASIPLLCPLPMSLSPPSQCLASLRSIPLFFSLLVLLSVCLIPVRYLACSVLTKLSSNLLHLFFSLLSSSLALVFLFRLASARLVLGDTYNIPLDPRGKQKMALKQDPLPPPPVLLFLMKLIFSQLYMFIFLLGINL